MVVSKSRQERRSYYSARIGKVPNHMGIDLPTLRLSFGELFDKFEDAGYFIEAFGTKMGKASFPGALGNVELHIRRQLRKQAIWPVSTYLDDYSEDDLFDVIELLFDHVSKGNILTLNFLGAKQFESYDRKKGRREFQQAINELLTDYGKGYELTATGEIRALPESGMDALMDEGINHPNASNVVNRVEAAKQKFLRRGSTADDQRDAVRNLSDVLEFLRDRAELRLNSKDEKDLFHLANRFGLRHNNENQKTDYDEDIWLSWMFYYYLATIHACTRLLEREKPEAGA